jgi:hypothetical protein
VEGNNMISQIVKTTDEIAGDLNRRYIFGLNIFPDDHEKYASLADPRLDFLRGICSINQVSAITGSLRDFGHTANDLFGNSNYRSSYKTVRIGCYSGDFYDSNDWNLFLPLFFPRISSNFIDIERDQNQSDDKSLVFSIIYSDALALFISPKTDDSETELLNLLNQPLKPKADDSETDLLNFLHQPIDHFLERAANLYEIVLTTQADGDYFVCYSQKSDYFDLLNEPLTMAVNSIEESKWFIENRADLIWDDKYSMCLVPK